MVKSRSVNEPLLVLSGHISHFPVDSTLNKGEARIRLVLKTKYCTVHTDSNITREISAGGELVKITPKSTNLNTFFHIQPPSLQSTPSFFFLSSSPQKYLRSLTVVCSVLKKTLKITYFYDIKTSVFGYMFSFCPHS